MTDNNLTKREALVARILAPGDWDAEVRYCDIGSREEVAQYAQEIVAALDAQERKPWEGERRFHVAYTARRKNGAIVYSNAEFTFTNEPLSWDNLQALKDSLVAKHDYAPDAVCILSVFKLEG